VNPAAQICRSPDFGATFCSSKAINLLRCLGFLGRPVPLNLVLLCSAQNFD
jgi:hypothetical protein